MGWAFALVNGKLAEIFFDKKAGKPVILGHCYVKKEEYKTKKEQKWIEEDTKKFRVVYRNKKYLVTPPHKMRRKRNSYANGSKNY